MNLGIEPPKGVLLFGPPGTGKTLCARAVANRTDACFIRVIGSELVQKYVGEVRNITMDSVVNNMINFLYGIQLHLTLTLSSTQLLDYFSAQPFLAVHLQLLVFNGKKINST